MEHGFFYFTKSNKIFPYKNPFHNNFHHPILQVGLKRIPFTQKFYHPPLSPSSRPLLYIRQRERKKIVDIYIYMCVSIHREIYILMCIIYIHLEFPNFNVCCCMLRVRAMWGRKWRVTFTLKIYILFYNISFSLGEKASKASKLAVENSMENERVEL